VQEMIIRDLLVFVSGIKSNSRHLLKKWSFWFLVLESNLNETLKCEKDTIVLKWKTKLTFNQWERDQGTKPFKHHWIHLHICSYSNNTLYFWYEYICIFVRIVFLIRIYLYICPYCISDTNVFRSSFVSIYDTNIHIREKSNLSTKKSKSELGQIVLTQINIQRKITFLLNKKNKNKNSSFLFPSLDKPARLIIRLLFGFVSDSETSATTPWEKKSERTETAMLSSYHREIGV